MQAFILLVLLSSFLVACSSGNTNPPSQSLPSPIPAVTTQPRQQLAAPTQVPPTEIPVVVPTNTRRPTDIPPTEPPQEITAVSTIDLKVRNGPGTGYPQTGVLKQGTRVVLWGISQDQAWFQHEQGWSSAAYMTTEADTSSLPVVLAEPQPTSAPPPTTKPPTSAPQPVAPRPTIVKPPPTNPPAQSNCDPSYPDFCLPRGIGDLDCPDIPYRRFRVLPPDPHRFDGDFDGIGCER